MEEKQADTSRSGWVARRGFFRGAGALLTGLIFSRAAHKWKAGKTTQIKKASVLSSCTSCTACVTICPKAAISISPDGIVVSDDLCIRCGYCVAACPVGGLKVNREAADV